MLTLIMNVVKKIVVAILLLYSLNILIASLNIMIPINIITIIFVSFLGIPGLLTLTILFLIL